MNDFIFKLVDNLKKVFDSNLICVLLLGSIQKEDTTAFSDIDLVVIIKSFNLQQMTQIRQLLRNSEKLIDLSFLCKNEISKNSNLFSLGTHGCYQLGLILNKAKCLYGKNILLDFDIPSKDSIRLSLVQKIIQYTWWIRRMFVESNRERSLSNNYQLNNRLIKMIRGILYLEEGFDIHSNASIAINYFVEKYSNMLSKEEKMVIMNLVVKELINENSANMSEEYFETRFSVINKIHNEALKFYY